MPSTMRQFVPVVAVRPRREGAGALVWTLRGLSAAILLVAVGVYLWRTQARTAGPTLSNNDRAVAVESTSVGGHASASHEPPTPAGRATTAASVAPSPGGADVAARMKSAADAKSWDAGADALLELIKADSSALKKKDAAAAAAAIAAGAAGDRADKVFDVLSKSAGEGGLEALYVVSGEDGKDPTAEPAKRALELLGSKDVIGQTTPAMRAAIELRRAPCMKKVLVFNKVKQHGDMRSVAVLEVLRARTCNKKRGECCFTDNNIVDDIIKTIRERTKTE